MLAREKVFWSIKFGCKTPQFPKDKKLGLNTGVKLSSLSAPTVQFSLDRMDDVRLVP
jgi:hypothetical protein